MNRFLVARAEQSGRRGPPVRRVGLWSWLLLCMLVLNSSARGDEAVAEGGVAEVEATDLFATQIAPLLEQSCLRCHAGLAGRGGLSLLTREEALVGGDSGPALEPGDAELSLLWHAVSGEAPQMPADGEPLSPEQVEALRQWINAGAPWPAEHKLQDRSGAGEPWWSLAPLVRPAVPTVADSARVRNPLDAFVLARLEEAGLPPSAEADRRTLIRRLTYDLHGLPPTPAEVAEFLADSDPGAYERLVERLLDSPRYGERWGRHWLDVARFAQTHGYDKDKRRDHAWPYRDWVIRSFNEDKPYARFIQEQLAGDVLFPDDPHALVATGFIAAGPWDFVGHVELAEGSVEKRKTRSLDRDEMLAATMGAFTGMTVHCARCHDHAFDPIPQRDYYRLQAVFAGVERGDRQYDSEATSRQRQALQQRLADLTTQQQTLQQQIHDITNPQLAQLDAELSQWREQLAALPNPWPAAAAPIDSSTNGYHSAIEADEDLTKWVQVDLGSSLPLERIRLLPARPTDFADTPGFGFPVRFQVAVSDDPEFASATLVADYSAADFANPGKEPVAFPVNARARYLRVTATRLWPRSGDYVFALAELQALSSGENIALGKTVTARDSIEAGRWSTAHLVDGSDSRHQLPELTPELSRQLAAREDHAQQILALQQARAALHESLVPPELREQQAALTEEVNSIKSQLTAIPAAQVYAVLSREPRAIELLARGDVEQPQESMPPGALSCLPELEHHFAAHDFSAEGARRAALAGWLSDPENPLVWRTVVNRLWHYHFGQGLVDTPNDLGRNGSLPSHPELLDWLAVEFRDGGQSLKQMHRLIVTSSTYRQTSDADPQRAALDSGNRLLWRANRQRLDAEQLRDSILAVSGKLDLTMGGPGFELFHFKDDHSPVYEYGPIDTPESYRRTVYQFIVRSVPNPLLETLDCADPSASVATRNTTITALQALATLNDPLVVRQSEYMAQRLVAERAELPEQIAWGMQLCYGRLPTAEEQAELVAYASRHGLPATCRVLFNTAEFVFVD